MRGKENPTDDAALFEKTGGRVIIVNGDEQNIKVTTPEDFENISRNVPGRYATTDDESRAEPAFTVKK